MSFVVLLLIGLLQVTFSSIQSITESLLEDFHNNNSMNKENTTNNVTTFNSIHDLEDSVGSIQENVNITHYHKNSHRLGETLENQTNISYEVTTQTISHRSEVKTNIKEVNNSKIKDISETDNIINSSYNRRFNKGEILNFSKKKIGNRSHKRNRRNNTLKQTVTEDSLKIKEEKTTQKNFLQTTSSESLKENNVLRKEEETLKDKNVTEITINDDSFDAKFQYSEEDLSVGVHTLDSEVYTINTYMANKQIHTGSKSSVKGGGSKYADEIKAFYQLLQDSLDGRGNVSTWLSQNKGALFTQLNGPQEFYLPTNCLMEWQDCNSDEDCCKSLYCSELPRLTSIYNLNESTTLEITRFCSRFKSTSLKNRTDIHTILDTFKRKMLDVLNS